VGEHDAQLEWERRNGRLAAAAAFASGVFLVAYNVLVSAVVLSDRPNTDRGFLVALDAEPDAYLIAAVGQALSFLALAVVLWYLFRVTRYRRSELPPWLVWLVYLGPLLLAVGSVLMAIDRIDAADEFTSGGEMSERRAENLLEERDAVSVGLGTGGTLALAISLVLVSMNAMRAGVLSRFLGIIGIIVGGLYVIPIFGGPLIVQIFWLGALGAVFLGYWPGGRGEAWETGTAVHWPSAAERRREALGAAAAAEAEQEPEAEPPEEPGPSRRRRKRRR
jgi:drug/metabolite transporter (DMT)-like permease